MPLVTKTFDVTVSNERSALAYDMRGAMVDFLRGRIAQTLLRAEDAEIDKQTALRRFSMTYAQASKGYKLPRTVPASLVRWAAYVEVNQDREGFPVAPNGTIGTFDKESVTSLPGNIVLIRMGGVTFAGVLEGGVPEDLFEVRVGKSPTTGGYVATLLTGRPDGEDPSGATDPVEPEDVDA